MQRTPNLTEPSQTPSTGGSPWQRFADERSLDGQIIRPQEPTVGNKCHPDRQAFLQLFTDNLAVVDQHSQVL